MAIDVPLQYTPKNYVLETLPVHLPAANFDDSIDIESIARPIIQSLPSLSAHSLSTEPIWRDVLALTGTLRTIYSADAICDAWLETCATRQARDFAYQPGSGRISRPDKSIGWIHVAFTFNVTASPAAECHGYLALVFGSDGQWKIWTIRTVLEQLVGCSNVDVLPDRSHQNHITNGINGVHENSNKMNGDSHFKSSFDYDVVIAGAGQAGLSTAGRLQALGVNYLVLETHPRVGENWATRYESAKLHTPKDYSQLPFARIFSSEYQEYLDKHDLVRGYKEFIHRFGIDKHISWNTTLTQGQWNGETWTLQILRSGKQETLSCRHVVLAVGSGGQVPLMPNLPGREYFQGQVLHSVDYHSADSWKGKKGIVVGTANTAHDVVSDMVEAGLQTTTMVQRGRTYVLPVEYFKAISDRIYNGKSRMEDVDREQHSQPQAVSRLLAMNSLNRMASQQPQRFDALERAGFKVERYGDITYQITQKRGGHYIDVGCSSKIAQGLIQMKSSALPTHYSRTGLVFDDGTEIAADVIVFCTGFRANMRINVEELFGKEIADRVDDFYTLDDEGELKGAFKPTGHPGLWYMGGTIGYCRYYSRHVALQIKASLMGTPFKIYNGHRRDRKTKMV